MTRRGRAVIAHGQDFEIREYAVPDPAPGALLLRQELAGICGTDLHMWQKGIPGELVLGHENVGIIDALGTGVTTDYVGNPLREGDRVIFAPGTPHGAYGFYATPDEAPHFRGGFADYIYLDYPNTCFIKTELTPEVAVLTEPFTIGVHAAMRGRIQIGDTVVVQGSGAIGLVTLVCARISGAAKIIMVGGPAKRLELAKRMGADVTIDIEQVRALEERKELVLSHTLRQAGADVVFECAGFLPATPEGLQYVKRNGVFVEVGHFVDMGSIELNINQLMMRRNLRFEAIWGSQYEHFVRGLPILERNEFPFAEMVSHALPLSRVRDGFDALNGTYRLGEETAIKIVVRSQE
ncbi:MAG: zinc-binding dehydrogenase [Caldilineaceae bacterium]